MNAYGLRVIVVLMNVCGLRVMAESQMQSHLPFPSMRTWGHITSRAGNHVTNKIWKISWTHRASAVPEKLYIINNTVSI